MDFNTALIEMRGKLFAFARKLTSNVEDAADLVQDTFVKALTNKEKFTDQTNFTAWVYTIMRNLFINNYRRDVRSHKIFEKVPELQNLAPVRISGRTLPDNVLMEKQIRGYIDSLSDDYREPLVMHISGYKYREISEKMGIPVGTVKSRIFGARQQLQNILEEK